MTGTGSKKKIQPKTCAEVGCKVKLIWYDTLPDGRRFISVHGRHHGETHAVRLLLPDGVIELEQIFSFEEKLRG